MHLCSGATPLLPEKKEQSREAFNSTFSPAGAPLIVERKTFLWRGCDAWLWEEVWLEDPGKAVCGPMPSLQ